MSTVPAIAVSQLTHRYGDRVAVDELSLEVHPGEIFVFLGPNGSGKTTLFRVLSTLIPLQSGSVSILGCDLSRDTNRLRQQLGVVFQAPSLDKKLTVLENLYYQGRLYGLPVDQLKERALEMMSALGIAERSSDLVDSLSGGLRRRVELAKGLLHGPKLVLLDEPSTGLDPGARADLWHYLKNLQGQGVTIVLTTHLLEEAERADRIAIMHRGKLAALDTPLALQSSIGGDAITIRTSRPEDLAERIRQQFDCQATVVDGCVRLEQPEGHKWISRLVDAFASDIETITVGKPTLEDVFIDRTGHQFLSDESSPVLRGNTASP